MKAERFEPYDGWEDDLREVLGWFEYRPDPRETAGRLLGAFKPPHVHDWRVSPFNMTMFSSYIKVVCAECDHTKHVPRLELPKQEWPKYTGEVV